MVGGATGVSTTAFCRRRTYFLSGFDPRGVAQYQRLFAGVLKQRGVRLGPRQAGERITRWSLAGRPAELAFLHWDDIARAHWPTHPWPLLRQLLGFALVYLTNLGFAYARVCPGVALCGLYPLMVLLLVLVLALAGAALAAAVWLPLAPLVLVLVLWQGWRWADRLGVVWLSRSILFTDRLGKARDRTLPQRVRELAQALIALEHNDPAAEVVLVGHSSGSFVMVMLAAELRRQPAAASLLPKLRLLSLGQNLANLALYPAADAFRADLAGLAVEPRLPWRDCSSHHDLLCFAGVNPYRACDMPAPESGSYPQLELLDLRTPRRLHHWWQWLGVLFDLHFDYLRDAATGVDLAGLIAAEVDC